MFPSFPSSASGCALCGPGTHQPLAGQAACLPCQGGGRAAREGVGARACPDPDKVTTTVRVGVEVTAPPGAYSRAAAAAGVGWALQVCAGVRVGPYGE